ncbi:MAG TPA: Fe-S cluster assembly protein SufD [Caulobacteraceae bacterium]|nr:Fe-S cluster assembly protein SufD [Caulobacteraceae bacterium]
MSLARAIEIGDLAELPSRRDEDWRWSDLRALIRELPAKSRAYAGAPAPGLFEHLAQTKIAIMNGRLPEPVPRPGVSGVLALRIIAQGDGAHAAHLGPIDVGGARLVLLETYEGDGDHVSELDLSFVVGAGGSLERIVLCDEPAGAVSVSHAEVSLAPGARFSQTVIAAGAKRQRIETRVSHPGGGAAVRLDGLYLVGGRRHADLTTVVTHTGIGGITDQLAKGVVSDQGRGVFQGRIIVAAGADRTDARMGHHALVLSDRAEVDAKPELEIFADDVACAHANTVGALDEDALFYAAQRGIPEPQARSLLTQAFVGEVIDRIEHAGAREIIRAWVAERLLPSSRAGEGAGGTDG